MELFFREARDSSAGIRRKMAQSAYHAEARALTIAVKTATDRCGSSVIFHSDSRDLVLVVNRRIEPPWDSCHVMQGILELCRVFY